VASFNRRTYGGEGQEQFTIESADAQEVYFLEADEDDAVPPTWDELQDKIKEVLGTTAFEPQAGQLSRTPPMAHPVYPNLTAYRVRVRPVAGDTFSAEEFDDANFLEAPPPDTYPLWDSYEFTIDFAPRPYAIVKDESIMRQRDTWTDETGAKLRYSFFPEWVRYTDAEILPRDDILKAKYGEMVFRAPGATVDKTPYVGIPFFPLPNDTLKLTWVAVPYRYITSPFSYIRRFRYCINQKAWEGWEPGSILYKGYSARRYSPPLAGLDPNWSVGVISTEKLCDITFEFIVTRRTVTNPPASVANDNWVVGGHNCLPRIQDRKFYYVSSRDRDSPDDQTKWFPQYKSFAIELLFQDPDVVEAVAVGVELVF
jgi:hypothetical protein